MKPRRAFKLWQTGGLLLVLGCLSLWSIVPASAAVTLVSFNAVAEDGQVRLLWETATEIDNAGFFVHRLTDPDTALSPATRLSEFIVSEGDSLIGASYEYLDTQVTNGTTYHYWLEAIANDQSSEYHGPRSATPGTPTETPTLTPTNNTTTPAGTPTRTRTPSPTRTSTPIQSATPGPTQQSSPTWTPTHTLTPTVSPTPTQSPLPTFLPTWTPTLVSPTPSLTPTLAPTQVPLLQSTLAPGGLLGDLSQRAGLVLGEIILLLVVSFAMLGGAIFTALYSFLQRRGNP